MRGDRRPDSAVAKVLACMVLAAFGFGGRVTAYEIAPIYADLRKQVLNLAPTDLKGDSALFAVLMETGYPEAVATLVAISDGTVSLYFSNGGGIIGAGEHDAVRRVAQAFLSSAEAFMSQASVTKSFSLPSRGNVRFYLVTAKGIYTIEAVEDDLGNRRHPFSPLFHQAHDLIAAIREHAPQ